MRDTEKKIHEYKKSKNYKNLDVILFHNNLASVSFVFVRNRYFGQLLEMRPLTLKFLKLANLYFPFTNVWFTEKYLKRPEIDLSSILLLFKDLMFLI